MVLLILSQPESAKSSGMLACEWLRFGDGEVRPSADERMEDLLGDPTTEAGSRSEEPSMGEE